MNNTLLRSILSVLVLLNTLGCATTKDPKQGSSQQNWKSIWLHQDTGAALMFLPIFITLYPLQLLSHWEINQWNSKVSLLKTSMSPQEVRTIIGRPSFIQKAANEKEIWHYGMTSYPHSISFTSKLKVTFEHKAVTKIEKNAIGNFQYY